MARSLAVKVPTASLIGLLKEKIATIEANIANYPAEKQKYAQDIAEYEKQIVALSIEALSNPSNLGERHSGKPIEICVTYYGNRSVGVTFDADALGFPQKPEEPKNPNEREWIGREHISKLDLLKKNLKVLEMTNQEEVNASTYSSVMDLL